MNVLNELRDFGRRSNIMDMAFGAIAGGAFVGVVSSLVNGKPLMALMNLAVGGVVLLLLAIAINQAKASSSSATGTLGDADAGSTSVCPLCRERHRPEATVCPHCGRDLPASGKTEKKPVQGRRPAQDKGPDQGKEQAPAKRRNPTPRDRG